MFKVNNKDIRTIETLKQGVNMFKVNNKNTRTTPMASFLCL